nr:PREDICTED: retinol dehydrogenase 12-like [Bemisia tabaci]
MGIGSSRPYTINSRIDGKTVLITGCNTGIGKFTAQELYRIGGRIIMACRDVAKAEQAAEDIRKVVSEADPENKVGELIIKKLDLGSKESIRSCADDIKQSEKQINILINNAGVMIPPYQKTTDGFELQFGTNHLGHFYLTYLLLPTILASTPARIVNVSSVAHERGHMNWDDLNSEKSYHARTAYSQSKLANVLFSRELASRLEGTGVNVYSLHPGIILTELGRHVDEIYFKGFRRILRPMLSPFTKSIEAGAATTLYCALDESIANESGCYYSDCAKKEAAPQARNDEDAKKLWEVSLKLLGLEDININEKQTS